MTSRGIGPAKWLASLYFCSGYQLACLQHQYPKKQKITWPFVDPSFFARAVRPTPPQKRRNTMQRFLSMTACRYFFAADRFMPLIALAVSLEFLKWTRRFEPLALATLPSISLAYFVMVPNLYTKGHQGPERTTRRSLAILWSLATEIGVDLSTKVL